MGGQEGLSAGPDPPGEIVDSHARGREPQFVPRPVGLPCSLDADRRRHGHRRQPRLAPPRASREHGPRGAAPSPCVPEVGIRVPAHRLVQNRRRNRARAGGARGCMGPVSACSGDRAGSQPVAEPSLHDDHRPRHRGRGRARRSGVGPGIRVVGFPSARRTRAPPFRATTLVLASPHRQRLRE